MTHARVDLEDAVFYGEDEPVRGVYSHTPFSGKVALERLRLANAAIAVAFNALENQVDALKRLLVSCLPFRVFRPRLVVPELLHDVVLRRRVDVLRVVPRERLCGLSSPTSMRSWKWQLRPCSTSSTRLRSSSIGRTRASRLRTVNGIPWKSRELWMNTVIALDIVSPRLLKSSSAFCLVSSSILKLTCAMTISPLCVYGRHCTIQCSQCQSGAIHCLQFGRSPK